MATPKIAQTNPEWECPDCAGTGRDGGSSAPCPTCLDAVTQGAGPHVVQAIGMTANVTGACNVAPADAAEQVSAFESALAERRRDVVDELARSQRAFRAELTASIWQDCAELRAMLWGVAARLGVEGRRAR